MADTGRGADARRRGAMAALSACAVALAGGAARAQQPGQSSPFQSAPGPNANPNPNVGQGTPGYLSGILGQSNLLGDMFGLRSGLAARGVTFGITETSEALGNATGGVRRGVDYDGSTLFSVGVDTARAFGLVGGTLNVSAFDIHGRDLSTDDLDSIQTASGIEALDTFRLWELWYDQATRGGLTDLKIGQQSIDQEFMTSTYSTLFVNTMMGWPALPSYDLYAGGPAYPLSSLGVRLRSTVGGFEGRYGGPVIAQIGVYDDDPPGGPFAADSQLRGAERTGTAFSLRNGALVIAEVQYAVGQPNAGGVVHPGDPSRVLPGTYRLGAWYDTARFPDQGLDAQGISLGSASSTGVPLQHRGNYSIYFSGDQEVWIDAASVRSVGAFLRVMGAPEDRNFIGFSGDAGLSLKAPFLSRPTDTAGIGVGVAKISGNASALDQLTRVADLSYPVRSSEQFLELTYQAQIAPWWQVQPDFQYVWSPGGGIPNPRNANAASTPRIGNEAVFGVRTTITF